MSPDTQGQSRTIVLRMWYERSLNEKDEEWRGEARDVLTGQVLYFRHLSGLEGAVDHLLRENVLSKDTEEVG